MVNVDNLGEQLKHNITGPDHDRLRGEFIENVVNLGDQLKLLRQLSEAVIDYAHDLDFMGSLNSSSKRQIFKSLTNGIIEGSGTIISHVDGIIDWVEKGKRPS